VLLGLSPLEIDAIRLSLEVSVSAMVWSLPVAVWVAWLLARKDFYGKSIVGGIIHLPLVLPPVVIGYLLLVAMGRNGFIGKYLYQWFGLTFGFSWKKYCIRRFFSLIFYFKRIIGKGIFRLGTINCIVIILLTNLDLIFLEDNRIILL